MGVSNRVSATMTDEAKKVVLDSVKIAQSKMPFLISVEDKERGSLRKAATKRQGYILDVTTGVKIFPDTMPRTFPTEEFLKDGALLPLLLEIYAAQSGLARLIEGTIMVLTSEMMAVSDDAYDFLKRAAKSDSSIQPIVDKIATF